MNRLRTRLIAVFLAATLVPLCLTVWITLSLLQRSLTLAPLAELDSVSIALENTGRELYQQARESLVRDVAEHRIEPRKLKPADAPTFWETGATEQFEVAGNRGDRLDYFVRHGEEVWVYSRPIGAALEDLKREYAGARRALEDSRARNLRRGFSWTLLMLTGALWVAAIAILVYLANRITKPVRQLTEGLGRVASGDLGARVVSGLETSSDEIGSAVAAFNHMADQMLQARERLIQVTRLASWQALAHKMAHEVKNSLTPIRLTMEEIISRSSAAEAGDAPDRVFLEQAAQIVADEVETLERRVRAFSQFAAEPPVMPSEIDVNALLEERISLLKSAHPEIVYTVRLSPGLPNAVADLDLIKGVLTNLLENAADAAQPRGEVLAMTASLGNRLYIEVHDSGPGLSAQARSTLFEPSISFKKGGMGLGLSIARRSAILCGGDLQTVDGELGGAAFRVILAATALETSAATRANLAVSKTSRPNAAAANGIAMTTQAARNS